MGRYVLVDYSWCAHRFHHAYRNLTFNGINTGQLFGFARLIESIVRRDKEAFIVFCKDSHPVDRHEACEDYKAGRKDSTEVYAKKDDIDGIISLCPHAALAVAEGKEADDVMAMLFFESRRANPDRTVVIYSGDDDLAQLLAYGVKIARKFVKGDFEFLPEFYVESKYQVQAAELLKWRCLIGDSSDNVKGPVPRLNRVWARKFLEYWMKMPLEKVYEVEELKGDWLTKVQTANEVLERNLKLFNLGKYEQRENCFPYELYKTEKDWELLKKYGLHSYSKWLYSLRNENPC